ncbi:MAG: MarR family winged helix-turn-helix transcriptional regulator [Gemmatimonadota bacterium]
MAFPKYHPPALPCACSALRQATRAVSRHYEACLAPAGVTVTQYSILRYLQREGASPLRRVADALELERTSLYRAMATLERDGLVESRVDPEDARVKQAELTETGGRKILETLPHWRRAQESFLAAVGDVEWTTVASRLEDLRESMAENPLLEGQLRVAER